LKLAEHFHLSDKEEERQRALELYRRYVQLEPDDPRGHSGLADLYEGTKDLGAAEAEYRAAITADVSNTERRIDLIEFLALNRKSPEAVRAINEARQNAAPDEDILNLLFTRLMLDDDINAAESIARAVPQEMAHSSGANL
jgi:Flp pilus assembly protein TadD